MVDVSLDRCLEQGHQHTTVEQIAASAAASTRTCSRYRPTTDAMFLALLDDYVHGAFAEVAVMARDLKFPAADADYEPVHG